MLISIIGNLGSGKTFIMTKLILNEKREIWSNYKLNLPNYHKLEVIDLLDLDDNIVILMDEAYAWIESRVSGSALNEVLSSVLYHSRKTFTDIYLTTPLFSTIDKRFRLGSNIIIECLHRSNFDSDDFGFIFYDIDDRIYSEFILDYKKAKEYFKYYNTLEKIESHRKRGLRFKLLKNYPDRLKTYVIELSELIESEGLKITHPSIKSSLLMNGIDLEYESLIYIYLKGKKEALKNDNN